MLRNPAEKYRPFPAVRLTGRKWPSRTINQAPIWMSTDLRDGNQALIEPMNPAQKLEFFEMLVAIGFKEIEVGFPSASQTDFDFVRKLIEEKRIPEDVTIEVFVPSRPELIARTFESLEGAPRAIVHLYNAICPSFRKIVFKKSKDEIKALAVEGTRLIKEHAQARPDTHWTFQYSPETFNTTELPYAREVCDAVAQTWRPTHDHKMIVNLPASVEAATPNVFADQIEWMDRNLGYRDSIVLSVHPHNDRGTAVAADGTGAAGRRGSGRRMSVRQRRAHRQCGPRDGRDESLHAGHRPGPRFLGYRRSAARGRALQPDSRASAASVCG